MNWSNLATIIVALIASLGAWAASKAAGNASRQLEEARAKIAKESIADNARAKREDEAYERARKLDTETITRQDKEIEELYAQNNRFSKEIQHLTEENESLHRELRALRSKVARHERELKTLKEENPHGN